MASLAYQPNNWISPREAEAIEARDGVKVEWMDGEIYAMAGASPTHNTLSTNLSGLIFNHLRGHPCQVWSSDLKVRVPETDMRAYPDVVVACPPHQWDEEVANTLLNPLLIIEILSPSTQAYDHTEKWAHYRRLNSLQEFILVSSDQMQIQHFRRQFPDNPERGEWILTFLDAPDADLELFSLDCRFSLTEIYERIEFPPARPPINETRDENE